MEIVEVIQGYTPADGITHAAVKIAEGLCKIRGLDVTLLYERGNAPLDIAKKASFSASVKYIARHADIAHSHIGTGVLKCNMAKAANPRVKHVTTYSVIAPPEHYPFYKRTMLFHKLAYAWGIDAAVGISDYAARDFQEKFHKRATRIYDGVDTKEFKPDAAAGKRFREKHGIGTGARVIGYVSRFNKHKNHESAIAAMPRMPKDVTLLLGGVSASKATDTLEHCHAVAKKLGVADRVKFLGMVAQAELNAFYNAIDVHAFPSQWEGFGLNVLEASAAGKPTVAYDVYSVGELVGPARGNGFAVRTQAEFTSALGRLVGETALARRIGGKARSFALGFDWSKVAARYANLFKELE